jgi:peptidoglycan/LPS O-acetylase OafA/YrhL
LDVTWSLAIEEQFYLLWPMAVYGLNRKRLLQVCAFVFVTAFLIRLCMTMQGINPIAVYVFTLGRFDAIAVGAFVALLSAGSNPIASSTVPRRVWLGTAVILVGWGILRGSFHNMDPMIQTVGLSLIAVNHGALLTMLLSLRSSHWVARSFSTAFLRAAGKYSYAMYLFHMPVRAFVRDHFYGLTQSASVFGFNLPGQVLFVTVGATLTFVIALISWHLWEHPFLLLKKHFPLGKKSERNENTDRSRPASQKVVLPLLARSRALFAKRKAA